MKGEPIQLHGAATARAAGHAGAAGGAGTVRPGCRLDLPRTAPGHGDIGLLAGWGRYPMVLARELADRGYRTHCAAVRGHADAGLARVCHDFAWVGLTRLGQAIRYFKRQGVRQATMAGKIHKVVLFQPWAWLKLVPDVRTARRFYKHFLLSRRDRQDDTLLMGVVREFARDGIRFAPATDFVPELLVKFGQLTRRGPSAAQRKDIEFGWKLAKELGRLDVGQSVAIKGRAALAVEAIEGTDACIQRAGALCPSGGFTVVKVAKPQQDMRFDVPTIGLGTLENMVRAGAACLAIESGRTILIDQAEVVRYAEEHRLALVALSPEGDFPDPSPEPLCESRER